jgi:phosphate transport system permease protein
MKTSSTSTREKIKGEAQVWLTGMGLAVALTMAGLLLWVIVSNGLAVFWPKRISEFSVLDGDKTTVIAGAVVSRLARAASSPGGAEVHEVQIFTGNKDVYKNAFRFIEASLIKDERQPEALIAIERLEYGDAIGYPQSLKVRGADKKIETITAEDARFEPELTRLVSEANRRWDDIRRLEKGRIGDNARALQALEIERKKLPVNEQEAVLAKIAGLKSAYQELAKEAGVLRLQQVVHKLSIRLASGETKDINIGKIVGVTWPNRMGFFERLATFVHRAWGFVSENPREANTEGGIFPAIFGTFAMTLLMSVAVVPVGVLAAIYLREYAKQGPLVTGVRIAVNNLAGVPSIVFGVFGLGFFVYLCGGSLDSLLFSDSLPTPTFGTGGIMWAAATLALMTVPVVIVATEESIAAVPRGMKEASLALGASKWQTIQHIVLPASVPGILTGTILAMARGAGEVAPLMLVGVVKLAPTLPINLDYPFIHLDQKFMHLGFHIYDLAFQSPDSEAARPAVYATTLLLILLVLVMNLSAILLRERLRKKFKTSAF